MVQSPLDIWNDRFAAATEGIFHFIGPVKPWHKWHRTDAQKLWRKYADKSHSNILSTPITSIEQLISIF